LAQNSSAYGWFPRHWLCNIGNRQILITCELRKVIFRADGATVSVNTGKAV